MERMAGTALPAKFISKAGQVFPMFYVIAGLNALSGGAVVITHSSDPLRVESMALRGKNSDCLWLANLTGQTQRVHLNRYESVSRHHRIPWETADLWQFQPSIVLEHGLGKGATAARELEVVLEPYGLHWLESIKSG
jgi:hypothetical protein